MLQAELYHPMIKMSSADKEKTQLEKSEIRFADMEKEVLVNAMAMLECGAMS